MKKLYTIAIFMGLLASCNTVQKSATNVGTSENSQSKTKTMSKKETVGTFLGAVIQNEPETMRKLANADYIQHNPFLPTGLEPFIQMMPLLQENGTTAENVRMFQDGNYVFMHNIWRNAKPFGAEEMVSFDIFA